MQMTSFVSLLLQKTRPIQFYKFGRGISKASFAYKH